MLDLSYPTVKGLLDELLGQLFPETPGKTPPDRRRRTKILERARPREITADEAAATPYRERRCVIKNL